MEPIYQHLGTLLVVTVVLTFFMATNGKGWHIFVRIVVTRKQKHLIVYGTSDNIPVAFAAKLIYTV